jgi:FkbM family methyltransferase
MAMDESFFKRSTNSLKKKAVVLKNLKWSWLARYALKHIRIALGYRLARLKGQKYFSLMVENITCKFTFSTPYHFLYAQNLAQGDHEQVLLSLWKKQAEQVMEGVIVDVGGYNGVYGLVAGLANPHVDVFIFEPDPINIEHIEKNIALNQLSRVHAVPLAVGDVDGKVFFREHRGGAGGYIIDTSDGSCSVYAVNFGKWLQEKKATAKLLKFDVYGAEVSALRSMEEQLRSTSPMSIILEFYPQNETKDTAFWQYLTGLGFSKLFLYTRSDGRSQYYFISK